MDFRMDFVILHLSVVWCMFLYWEGGVAVNYVYSIPIHKCIRWDMIFLVEHMCDFI